MQEIKQIVKDYLETPKTDYALMIKGDWGCGKTYFIKNSLFSYINEIESLEKNKEGKKLKYDSHYISLFGVTSSDEINEKIQLELNPWMKSKLWLVTKTGLNKFASFFNIGFTKKEEQKFISIINIKQNNVLFFDDLERIRNKENLPSILGQINQLTEHQNLKVIIVCNSKKADELFSKTNEKTIRFSTLYQPDIRSIYDEIIKNYDAEYNSFLNDKKDFILKIFEEVSYNNLRTLRFILDIFQKVFQTTKPEKYKNEIIERFLLFLTIFSIENKEGNPPECLNKLKEFGPWEINFDMDALLPAGVPEKEEVKDKSEEDIYYQDVLNKYKPYIESFHYSEQLANYINTGYLEQEKLEQEIIELVEELKKKEDSEETKTLKAIQNWQNTEKEKFSELLANTLGKVESGTLTMGAYLHILGELLKIEFYQIEDFKVDKEVIEQFKKGIDKSRTLHKSDNSFEIRLSRWGEKEDSPAKNKFNDIRDYLIEANQSCGLEEKSSIKNQILEFIKNNDSEKLTSFHKEMGYIGEPFLADASPEIFFGNIEKSDRTTQEAFNYFLRDRYYNIEGLIEKEKGFLMALQTQIEVHFKEIHKKKIQHIRLLEIKATIEFFLEKLIH